MFGFVFLIRLRIADSMPCWVFPLCDDPCLLAFF